MDEHDLDLKLLRSLGQDLTEPPHGLQEHVEEEVWKLIIAEEKSTRSAHTRARGWSFGALLRPMVAAGAAAALLIGVSIMSDGGPAKIATTPNSQVTKASNLTMFDSTANSIFGAPDSQPANTDIQGRIDLSSQGTQISLANGPRHDKSGDLSRDTKQLAQSISRDPVELRSMVRSSVKQTTDPQDHDDHSAFQATVRWISDSAVPADLRAAMLRSLGGLNNVDDAFTGTDLLGRYGVVLGHRDLESAVRLQAVLDQRTGVLLEERAFTTSYLDPACPPGTFTSLSLYINGKRVESRTMPGVDWPQIVPECSQPLIAN